MLQIKAFGDGGKMLKTRALFLVAFSSLIVLCSCEKVPKAPTASNIFSNVHKGIAIVYPMKEGKVTGVEEKIKKAAEDLKEQLHEDLKKAAKESKK